MDCLPHAILMRVDLKALRLCKRDVPPANHTLYRDCGQTDQLCSTHWPDVAPRALAEHAISPTDARDFAPLYYSRQSHLQVNPQALQRYARSDRQYLLLKVVTPDAFFGVT